MHNIREKENRKCVKMHFSLIYKGLEYVDKREEQKTDA